MSKNRAKYIGVLLFIVTLTCAGFFVYRYYQLKPPVGKWIVEAERSDPYTFKVYADSGKAVVNAVQIDLGYNPGEVENISFNKEGSICTLWVYEQPKIETAGLASIACGVPNPGFSGKNLIGTFVIKAKKGAKLKITESSQILLNDGKGTALPFGTREIVVK